MYIHMKITSTIGPMTSCQVVGVFGARFWWNFHVYIDFGDWKNIAVCMWNPWNLHNSHESMASPWRSRQNTNGSPLVFWKIMISIQVRLLTWDGGWGLEVGWCRKPCKFRVSIENQSYIHMKIANPPWVLWLHVKLWGCLVQGFQQILMIILILRTGKT